MEGYPFSCAIQVRWRDLDAFGHVNNAVFASYLEMARTEVWTKLFGGREALGIPFFVKKLKIDYKRPIALDGDVWVRIRVGEIRGASFVFEYLVEANGEIAAEASTRLACVDNRTGRPGRIEPDVRATLETLQR
jgi:acyl-CoA thioester hydrolase